MSDSLATVSWGSKTMSITEEDIKRINTRKGVMFIEMSVRTLIEDELEEHKLLAEKHDKLIKGIDAILEKRGSLLWSEFRELQKAKE